MYNCDNRINTVISSTRYGFCLVCRSEFERLLFLRFFFVCFATIMWINKFGKRQFSVCSCKFCRFIDYIVISAKTTFLRHKECLVFKFTEASTIIAAIGQVSNERSRMLCHLKGLFQTCWTYYTQPKKSV